MIGGTARPEVLGLLASTETPPLISIIGHIHQKDQPTASPDLPSPQSSTHTSRTQLGGSTYTCFDLAVRCVGELLRAKVIQEPNDHVGLIFYNTVSLGRNGTVRYDTAHHGPARYVGFMSTTRQAVARHRCTPH